MAYDEQLAARVRPLLADQGKTREKKMFGGLTFLLAGNISVGVRGAELPVRVTPGETDALLREAGVRRFDISGRPMQGWLLVAPECVADTAALRRWVQRGLTLARSLPAKK